MDNRRNERDTTSFLTRMFQIPAWLLLLIVIIAILAPVLGITIPAFVWALIVILLAAVGWMRAQATPPSGRTVELSDEDAPDYTLRFSNLPDDVNPRLLKIEDREKSKNSKRDKEIGKVLFIVADFAFFDNNNNLVTSFNRPVRLTFNYTDQDRARLLERTKELIQEDRLGKNEEARLVPIYQYSPELKTKKRPEEEPNGEIDETGENQIWMPFLSFTRDEANQTLTVEFRYWGDRQAGGGTQP